MGIVNYKRDTLETALQKLHIDKNNDILRAIDMLLKEGYTHKAIVFALNFDDVEVKIRKFYHDNRLASIFINAVRIHSFKTNNKRWELRKKSH